MNLVEEETTKNVFTHEQVILQLYQGAKRGAWLAFGSGTVVHSPDSIAGEVVSDYLQRRISIQNPYGFGKRAGYRKAISSLRAEATRRRHHSMCLEKLCELDFQDQKLTAIEEREKLLAFILSLDFAKAVYLLGRYYFNMTYNQIGKLYELFDGPSVLDATQRKRLSIAKEKLRELLDPDEINS
jgi:DNA-directed RNA polymerase specialized sigma24 family protein